MIFEAIEFAAKAHGGQFRKGTNLPYIIHPLGVAKVLIEAGCSEEIVVAGILHDAVEDTSVTVEEIRQTFGEEVARLVEGVSEPDKSDTWEHRKQRMIASLKTAHLDVLLVSCADKIDNIRAIWEDYAKLGEAVWARFRRQREQQQWYYGALADVFLSRAEGETSALLFTQFEADVHKVFGRWGIAEKPSSAIASTATLEHAHRSRAPV